MTDAKIDVLTPVLTDNWGDDRAWTLAAYEQRGGYDALRKAVTIEPADRSPSWDWLFDPVNWL